MRGILMYSTLVDNQVQYGTVLENLSKMLEVLFMRM